MEEPVVIERHNQVEAEVTDLYAAGDDGQADSSSDQAGPRQSSSRGQEPVDGERRNHHGHFVDDNDKKGAAEQIDQRKKAHAESDCPWKETSRRDLTQPVVNATDKEECDGKTQQQVQRLPQR